jgi:hypothetical protein
MNDKIKDLAEQAGMVIVDDQFSTYGKFAEKFAKLIVKECIDCVDDLIEPDPYTDTVAEDLYRAHNYALKQAMKHIANRFGIES